MLKRTNIAKEINQQVMSSDALFNWSVVILDILDKETFQRVFNLQNIEENTQYGVRISD